MFNDESEPPTLNRLNALMAAGYRIEESTSQEVCNAIWLDHPAKNRVSEKTLIIYNDGLVVGECWTNPEKKQLRIHANQEDEFYKFVRAVPKPNIWEKTANIRYGILGSLIMIVIYILTCGLLEVVFKFFKSFSN